MPRIKYTEERAPHPQHIELVDVLVQELDNPQNAGQPLIEEQPFPTTNNLRTTVVWDRWQSVPEEERSTIIREAYHRSKNPHVSPDSIVLALGLTFPEAYESGMLPWFVIPSLRRTDPVTAEQCLEAMRNVGASELFGPKGPRLYFPTQQAAQACVAELVKTLPESAPIWTVGKELGAQLPCSE